MLKCKLNTSIKYKGEFHLPNTEIEIDEKDKEQFEKYGVVFEEAVKVVEVVKEVVKEVKVESKPKRTRASKKK